MKRSLVLLALGLAACSNPTGPSPVPNTDVSSKSSTPLVIGTPQFIAAPPPDGAAWAVRCSDGGTMEVRYSGEASYARLLTYYTSFDGPAQYAEQWDTVATGNTVTRKFPSCTQGDAEPESGRPAGHCYFDSKGSPASAQDATASCKPTPQPTPKPTPTPEPRPTPTPEPTGACHISNLGNDQNNHKLQVNWVGGGNGHEDHGTCTATYKQECTGNGQNRVCKDVFDKWKFNPLDWLDVTKAQCDAYTLADVKYCTAS